MAQAMAATDPDTPEIGYTDSPRVACDGAAEISPALGHPRVWLQIGEEGFADCGYCDKRFILRGGPADER
jgi:NADH dehydrogenase (ubiquinone) Fe-S protein 6